MEKSFGYNRALRRFIVNVIIAVFSSILGLLALICDIQDLALTERIRFRPSMPYFEIWKNFEKYDLETEYRAHLYHVENPHEFLTNSSEKLQLKSIGPIVYNENIWRDDIVFHTENSTMSFTTNSRIEINYEKTNASLLNQTITIINPVLLSLAAKSNSDFVSRMLFNVISKGDHVFLNRTVYQILWNYTTPTYDVTKKIPFVNARENAGILFNLFYEKPNRYNVDIGTKHGNEHFFRINTFNGLPRFAVYPKNYPKQCPYSINGSTEGSGFPSKLKKNYVFYAFYKSLCRTLPFVYNRAIYTSGLKCWEFTYSDTVFTRLNDTELDCFKSSQNIPLPDGLSDFTACSFGLPMAMSNPHFYGYKGVWENYIGGLTPNEKDHGSFFVIEPITGAQIKATARLQNNIIMPNLRHVTPDIQRFSNMIIPVFWAEYICINKEILAYVLIFGLVYTPVMQVILILSLFVFNIRIYYKIIKIRKELQILAASQTEEAILQKTLLS